MSNLNRKKFIFLCFLFLYLSKISIFSFIIKFYWLILTSSGGRAIYKSYLFAKIKIGMAAKSSS